MKKLPKAPGNRVLIQLQEHEQVSTGGIVIRSGLDSEKERAAQFRGFVLDVGPDAYKDFSVPWCKKGDFVQISRYSGVTVFLDDDKNLYRMINDIDVHATWSKEDL